MTGTETDNSPLRLFWWQGVPNFGDAISPLIVAHLARRPVEHAGATQCDVLAIGSLLQVMRRNYREPRADGVRPWIWGAGLLRAVPTDFLDNVQVALLRGPIKKGDRLKCSHTVRQRAIPVFPKGKLCIVAAGRSRGSVVVSAVKEVTKNTLGKAKLACSIPIGWRVVKGELVSPWAALGAGAWQNGAAVPQGDKALGCAKSGRPALLCGDGAALSVSHVPPKKVIKWTNPNGDGEYKITVTNTTDKPIEVAALLTDGKKILWSECLVILCQGKTYTVPGAKGVSGDVKAVTLKAGQSVSTVVNALRLKGPKWPRGGYRIAFQFALGELSSVQSFYYLSRHHDKVRAGLK